MRRLIPLIALATLALALSVGPATVASAGGGAYCAPQFTDAETDVVRLSNNCFVPTIARVEQGTKVTFVNQDLGVPHTVTGAVYIFGDMTEFTKGERSFSFDEEGIFPYVCIIHPGMAGAIVVGDGEGRITTSSVSGGVIVPPSDATSTSIDTADAAPVEQAGTQPTAADHSGNLLLLALLVVVMAGAMWWLRRKPQAEV